jgi:hypothetical protein
LKKGIAIAIRHRQHSRYIICGFKLCVAVEFGPYCSV